METKIKSEPIIIMYGQPYISNEIVINILLKKKEIKKIHNHKYSDDVYELI